MAAALGLDANLHADALGHVVHVGDDADAAANADRKSVV